MLELNIKKADGTLYWREYFNTRPQLDEWIGEEKKRSTWKAEYTTQIVDKTPTGPTDAEKAAEAAKQAQIAALKQTAKDILTKADNVITAAEVKTLLLSFLRKELLSKGDV